MSSYFYDSPTALFDGFRRRAWARQSETREGEKDKREGQRGLWNLTFYDEALRILKALPIIRSNKLDSLAARKFEQTVTLNFKTFDTN